MNSVAQIPPQNPAAPHRVEFFRLPQPGKRDPFFGLSRGWYYKAEAAGEIRMVAIRNRGAVRGVRAWSPTIRFWTAFGARWARGRHRSPRVRPHHQPSRQNCRSSQHRRMPARDRAVTLSLASPR